jgi:DNA-binding winged helix-turn-helix (wHTH) protein
MKVSQRGTVTSFCFGPFRLNTVHRTLLRGDERLALPSKAFDTLVVLVEHRGTVVDKKTLMDLVWPDTAVEENNLAQGIASIRKALGEQSGEPRYVLTVPGRGYSFVAEVKEDLPPAAPPLHRQMATPAVLLAAVGVLIAAILAAIRVHPNSAPEQVRLVSLTGGIGEGTLMSFSPNGDRLAYFWRPDDGRPAGTYVKVIGAGDPFPLAVGYNQDSPAWSPMAGMSLIIGNHPVSI